ncbi:hypothetical protein SBA2_230005 [Acidobacteriia bacterium SbA2]|nr:hypothetical protein SBA2_230005 [Acidobacteriia bacterium SbA2]
MSVRGVWTLVEEPVDDGKRLIQFPFARERARLGQERLRGSHPRGSGPRRSTGLPGEVRRCAKPNEHHGKGSSLHLPFTSRT